MPILSEKSASELLLPQLSDMGLAYFEAQKYWRHRAASEDDRVTKYLRALTKGKIPQPNGKTYPHAERIPLQVNTQLLRSPLFELLKRRQTVRVFAPTPALAFDVLSTLFWAGYGPQSGPGPVAEDHIRPNHKMMPIPGGIQALEFYFAAFDVRSLPQGLYHFSPKNMVFERLCEGDLRPEVASCYSDPLIPSRLRQAKGAVFISAQFDKLRLKYGQRYLRFALLEAGLALQNLELAATAMGLGMWLQGSHFEEETLALLDLDDQQENVLISGLIGEAF